MIATLIAVVMICETPSIETFFLLSDDFVPPLLFPDDEKEQIKYEIDHLTRGITLRGKFYKSVISGETKIPKEKTKLMLLIINEDLRLSEALSKAKKYPRNTRNLAKSHFKLTVQALHVVKPKEIAAEPTKPQ